MMFDLSTLYYPLTATPLGRRSYDEIPPCAALKPLVRCFWYSRPSPLPAALVTPDTCMDLLFVEKGEAIQPVFCPLSDETVFSTRQNSIVFAVRFYAWSAALFADESLAGTLNKGYDSRVHFPLLTSALLAMLEETPDFAQRCRKAETILLAFAHSRRQQADFLNAMYALLRSQGRMRVSEAAQSVPMSTRQVERIFERMTGAPPKKLSAMIRYQNLWREAVFSPRFDIQDAVSRYGYTDQSHLLRQFKQYHSLTLSQAVNYAHQHVAFLQDGPELSAYHQG